MKKTGPPTSMKYISRMDYNKVKGYQVRFGQGINCKNVCRFFSKVEFGTWKKTLIVAKAWRGKTWKTLPPKRIYRNYCTGRGYHFTYKRKMGVEYGYWVATWNLNGKKFRRSFSVSKYGTRKAKRMAMVIREKNTQHHKDRRG